MNKTTNTSVNKKETPLLRDARIPRNLADWTGNFELIRMVLEAMDRADVKLPGNFAAENSTFRAPMLLTLLTTAYARGIYSAREIEAAITTDRPLQYICGTNRPTETVLRLFRKQNLALLQKTMAELLEEVWNVQYPARRTANPESYAQASLERWDANATLPIFATEATSRLQLAIMADSLMRDE